jgi:hypothetical protein
MSKEPKVKASKENGKIVAANKVPMTPCGSARVLAVKSVKTALTVSVTHKHFCVARASNFVSLQDSDLRMSEWSPTKQ